MNIFYRKYGTAGKPIFILHGIFGMLDNWHNIAKKLAENYTVYTLDARNHGQSSHSPEMSYAFMAKDVIAVADSLALDTFILIGHSMGGKTAMWTAHEYSHRIEKLILVDIAPKTYKAGHLTYFEAFENIAWHTLTNRTQIDEALKTYEKDMGVRLFLAKNIDRNDAGTFSVKCNVAAIKNAYQEIISKLEFTNIYPKETLFILGEKSNYLKEDDKPYINTYFPKAKYVNIANAGHWVHADNPLEFLEAIELFLLE